MDTGTVKMFCDEEIHTIDAVVNRWINRFLAKSVKYVNDIFCTKHTAQVVILGFKTTDRKKERRYPPTFSSPGRE